MSDIPTIVIDMTGGVIQWSASTCEVHIIVVDTEVDTNAQIGPDGKAAWIGTDLPDVDPATVVIWEKTLLDAAQAEDAAVKYPCPDPMRLAKAHKEDDLCPT